VEHAHRSTLENHVHRSPRLGSRRSIIVRVGIRASTPCSPASDCGLRCRSRYTRTCCAMLAATPWPTPAMILVHCKLTSGTKTSSTQSATRSSRPIGSGTFGDCNPPLSFRGRETLPGVREHRFRRVSAFRGHDAARFLSAAARVKSRNWHIQLKRHCR